MAKIDQMLQDVQNQINEKVQAIQQTQQVIQNAQQMVQVMSKEYTDLLERQKTLKEVAALGSDIFRPETSGQASSPSTQPAPNANAVQGQSESTQEKQEVAEKAGADQSKDAQKDADGDPAPNTTP